jgi:hypothetical protein
MPKSASRNPALLIKGPTAGLRLQRNNAPSLAEDGDTRGSIDEDGNCTFGGYLGHRSF